MNIKERIDKLRLLKRHYDLEYWKNNNTSESDDIYDQICKELNELLNNNPEFKIKDDDILESIHMNTFYPVKHKYRMLSLDKCLSINEFIEWYNKFTMQIKAADISEIIFEYKIDGFAICLEYENGMLIRGSTRGDGSIGDDITQTVFQIKDIQKRIDKNFTGQIVGEIYMTKTSLELLNKKLINENKKPLKNVRNAAAGIARQKDVSSRFAEFLNFLCYKVNNENYKYKTYTDEINFAKCLGFNTVHNLTHVVSNINELNQSDIKNILKDFEYKRDKLNLDVDGVVIKINDKNLQQKLGEKDRFPNWAIAYKFPAIEKLTTLLNIEWEYGVKDGRLTPMAVIEPIDIGGTTIKRPTLHNWDRIQELDVKIGDTIKVSRRGDVIPHVEDVITELRPTDAKDIDIPTCHICGKKAVIAGAYIKCDNKDCTGKISGKINVFIKSMEIENLGTNTVEKLIDSNKINSISDLYKLSIDDISELEKMGDKSANKIINNINKSKEAPLWRVLCGLSIPMVGQTTAKILENKFKSIEEFKSVTLSELLSINGMGTVVSNNIFEWLSNNQNIELLNELIDLKIGFKTEVIQIINNKLNGLKIAFTGKLSNWSREECKKIILSNGGIPWDIKKEISILLIGQGAKDAKIEKAKKLGASIITEQEFLNMIK